MTEGAVAYALLSTFFDCIVGFLQGKHVHFGSLESSDAASDGSTTRKGGDTGHSMLHRGAANGALIEEGTLAKRSVQNEIDLAALDHVNDVRSPFVDFVDRLYWDTALFQGAGRSTRSDKFEPKLMEPVGDANDVLLVVLVHAGEGRTGTRQVHAGAHL